jgi:hypothetical protein
VNENIGVDDMFRLLKIVAILIVLVGFATTVEAGSPLEQCSTQPSGKNGNRQSEKDRPSCGIELTCTDRPAILGHSQGICFRATCAGVWALLHNRLDQASFRRRFFSYKHYSFCGYWDLKDQGTIEAGAATVRELFLVLPGDLIEFKMLDPDPYARIEVKNLGYIKKGSVGELQRWLAYQAYVENYAANRRQQEEAAQCSEAEGQGR